MVRHILVPVDGSPEADAALRQAVALAKAFGAQLTLVTVYDPFPFVTFGPDSGFPLVEYLAAAKTTAKAGIQGKHELKPGADMTARELVMGSVAQHVLQRTRLPVMVVHA
mgnify:CR=1 FL=1